MTIPWLRGQQERPHRHRQLDLPEQLPVGRAGGTVAASTTVGGTDRIPTSTSRMTGGDREDHRRHDRGEPGRLEEGEGRDQVDERRHRLGRVEDRPEDRLGAGRGGPSGSPIAIPMRSVSDASRRGRSRGSPSSGPRGPAATIRPRQTAATIAGRRPDTYHATRATTAMTSHHGASVRSDWSGLSPTSVIASLIAMVTPENVSDHPVRRRRSRGPERDRDRVRERRRVDDQRREQAGAQDQRSARRSRRSAPPRPVLRAPDPRGRATRRPRTSAGRG